MFLWMKSLQISTSARRRRRRRRVSDSAAPMRRVRTLPEASTAHVPAVSTVMASPVTVRNAGSV